jgi:hypothetical protein
MYGDRPETQDTSINKTDVASWTAQASAAFLPPPSRRREKKIVLAGRIHLREREREKSQTRQITLPLLFRLCRIVNL